MPCLTVGMSHAEFNAMKNRKTVRPRCALARGSADRHSKHKMARFPGGWNYRGYCVYRKHKGNAGCLWQMADETDEWAWFFRTLAEFRKTCDRWERQRAKASPNQ